MTKRRYVPTKKLGSKNIDLPLSKKKEYADEESRLLNMMENLELEEEEKKDLEAEDDVQEVPVTKKKPQEEEKKKVQRQITSFFLKK